MTGDYQDVLFEARGGIGVVTLNRPKALNALTTDMIRHIHPRLDAWAADPAIRAVVVRGTGDRAFCAGGDIRAIYDSGLAWKRGEGDASEAREFFRAEYRLNHAIGTFPKPYVALLDGITMGGGVGLSVHGSHRVVTEKTLFAMPETGIGLFPDVGGSYFLPRCPGEIGTYLGLTGARLAAADLLHVGIGTQFVPSSALDALVADLTTVADWGADPRRAVDGVLDCHEADAGAPTLPAHRAAIDRCFAHDRVEDILAALRADGSGWAMETAATLARMSPTSLKVTLAQLRRGRALDLAGALRLEFRMTQAVVRGNDIYEGVRAVIVDKDRNPKWRPASLEEIGEAEVEGYFAPQGAEDLTFG